MLSLSSKQKQRSTKHLYLQMMSCSSEKPNFSQKCSMLSQYLKEKGSFGDLSFGISPTNIENSGVSEKSSPATTMNLFPIGEKTGDVSSFDARYGSNSNLNMSLFPHQGSYGSASSGSKPITKEPESSQMTIFYAGQVIVFDDFPAEKAKEIMLLAGMRSQATPLVPKTGTNERPSASFPMINQNAAGSFIPPTPGAVPNFRSGVIPEHIQRPVKPVLCDLPIARKASLHRFLEKRKDRINSRTPYQICSPSKRAETEGTSRVDMERDLLNNISSQ